MIPVAGTFRLDSVANNGGNNPSRAAAIGTCPIIKVQPFSAPIDDKTTAMDTAIWPGRAPHHACSVREGGKRMHQLLTRQ